ncbi:response regulator transcription factor [Citricoccus alkalitolerans]|uniref:LuxR C-terminal-related transcriptional regulator n=1 Tax=Citricoccus alkalitolerans TaxID=246603 RepID=A0ABV8Y1E8_9MICC
MAQNEVLLTAAREAYARGEWDCALRDLAQARSQGRLSTHDLDLLGSTQWWVGEVAESLAVSEEVYHRYQDDGDELQAAMKALSLGLLWFVRGELTIASGWASRARRLLKDLPECPERGYLLYLDSVISLDFNDLEPTRRSALRLEDMGRRLQAPELTSFSLVLSGLAEVWRGDPTLGFAYLDEAMLPVLAGQLPPEWAGDVYCTVIHVCHLLADLPRMHAWTKATEQWCRQFQGEVVYSGICRVHRLQLLCVEGHWRQAEDAIERSGSELIGRNNWVAGEAYYQLGEIRRLRGDGAGAQAAYDQAQQLGTDPQPGASLLRHAEGHSEEAWTGLHAALSGRDRLTGAGLVRAGVTLALAVGRLDEAERLCVELEATAATFGTTGFRAWAAHARGSVLVAQSRFAEALPVLSAAAADYATLRARYEGAVIRELLARAHAGLGEDGTAAAARSQALSIYRALGADPDAQRLESGPLPGGLTAREADVLSLIASGASDKAAAEALFISRKTVSRHLTNIFAKIGVSSRTAAAAWAFEHGLHRMPHIVRGKMGIAPDVTPDTRP